MYDVPRSSLRALLALAAPAERANALSLSNPGAAAAVQEDTRLATTEVHWRHHAIIISITIIVGTAGIIITAIITVTGTAGDCDGQAREQAASLRACFVFRAATNSARLLRAIQVSWKEEFVMKSWIAAAFVAVALVAFGQAAVNPVPRQRRRRKLPAHPM